MKQTKDVIACVVDFGMVAVPFAQRLARDMKKVYVFSEWEEDYSTLNKALIGDGYEDIERVPDIWGVKNEVDLFVFPDIQRAGLQLELERQGKAVWGSRTADEYELDREMFLKVLQDVGMKVPPHKVIEGVNAVRSYLKDKEDFYIKVSRYRGSFETCHYRNWKMDEGLIDSWATRFGPAKELVRFLVFPNIDTKLEIGCDTYCVDGEWPSKVLHGVEWKDKCYIGAVTGISAMPTHLRKVLNKFGPLFGERKYRNQFSSEVRVKGSEGYFIDPTCRMGLPSTGSQLEIWKNWSDIVWHGANGEMVQPIAGARFSAEAILTAKKDCDEWGSYEVPQDLKRWTKFQMCYEQDGNTVIPARPHTGGNDVGWLVALGDSIEDAVKTLNKQADNLPDGLDACTECLPYVIGEIKQMEKQGIKLGEQNAPKPSVAV